MNEKTFRHAIDASPWNHEGNSFWGLKRKNAKLLGLAFIGLGLLMAFPPFIPSPDDMINVFIAGILVDLFHFSEVIALTLTYTLIAWSFIYIGIVIYPYNTRSMFNGLMNRIKRKLIEFKQNPVATGIIILVGYAVFRLYLSILGG